MAADTKDEIEFSLKGLMAVLDGFQKVQQAAAQTAQVINASLESSQKAAAAAAQSTSRAAAQAAGSAQSGASASSNPNPSNPNSNARVQAAQSVPSSPSGRAKGMTSGPRQKLSALRVELGEAVKAGDTDRIGDIQDAIKRNERQIKAAQPKGFKERAIDAVKTSRLNLGVANPLVGKLLSVLGPEVEAVAGPIGIMAGAAVAGAAALYKLAADAAEAGNSFARFQIATGSSAQTSANLQSIGVSAGLSSDRVGAIAQEMQSRITSDPAAMAAGLRAGVFNLPGPYGQQDYGKNLEKVFKSVRAIQDPQEKLRQARMLGVEDLLPAMNTSKRQQAYEQPDADVRSRMMTPQFVQDSADFQAAAGRVSFSVENLMAALGPTVLPRITDFLDGLANSIESFAGWVERNQGWITKVMDYLIDSVQVGADISTGNLIGAGKTVLNMGGGQDAYTKALTDNTAATDKNTAATNQQSGIGMPGSYGNINRQGVMPADLNGYAYTKGKEAGGFALSTI